MHTRDDDMQVCNTHTQERTAIVNGRRDAEPIKLAIIERSDASDLFTHTRPIVQRAHNS